MVLRFGNVTLLYHVRVQKVQVRLTLPVLSGYFYTVCNVHEISLCWMITDNIMLDDILMISHNVNDKLGRTKIPRNFGCSFVWNFPTINQKQEWLFEGWRKQTQASTGFVEVDKMNLQLSDSITSLEWFKFTPGIRQYWSYFTVRFVETDPLNETELKHHLV